MRYQLQENLFVVHFEFPLAEGEKQRMLFRQPMLYDDVFPSKCHFNLLTVTEHHKVHNEWGNREDKPECDGFILIDASGQRFANQYPTAAYGQTTDTADRRFNLSLPDEDNFKVYFAENPNAIYQYHLLSDMLVEIHQGILGLSKPECNEEQKAKAKELGRLYEFIIAAFKEAYPEYTVELSMDQLCEGSTFSYPKVAFVKVTEPTTN